MAWRALAWPVTQIRLRWRLRALFCISLLKFSLTRLILGATTLRITVLSIMTFSNKCLFPHSTPGINDGQHK